MTISDILKGWMDRTGNSAAYLADRSGINKGTLSLYLNGKQDNPNINTLKKLAHAMAIPFRDLLAMLPDDTDLNWDAIPALKEIPLFRIPVYSRLSCGTGSWIGGDQEEDIAIPIDWVKQSCEYFANQADGDSMEPKIHNGDYLVFEKSDVVPSGKIGSFSLNGEYYCKRYKQYPDGTSWLLSDNSEYSPIPIHPGDDFRPIGIYKFKLSKEQ